MNSWVVLLVDFSFQVWNPLCVEERVRCFLQAIPGHNVCLQAFQNRLPHYFGSFQIWVPTKRLFHNGGKGNFSFRLASMRTFTPHVAIPVFLKLDFIGFAMLLLEITFFIFALVGSFTALGAYCALFHSFPLVLLVRELINSFPVYFKGEAVDFSFSFQLASFPRTFSCSAEDLTGKALITGSYRWQQML